MTDYRLSLGRTLTTLREIGMAVDAHAAGTCRWCDSARGHNLPLPEHDATTRIAYDVTLMRVGCPIVQAAMGGDPGVVTHLFDSETWVSTPTPAMRLYDATAEQIRQLVDRTKKGADR